MICAFALCACGGGSSDAESEQVTETETTTEAPQDPLAGQYDLLGVTCQISDDIDSYLTAPIDEELSQQFGEEQIYLNNDGSFERKAGDIDVDSGTWERATATLCQP